VEKYHKIQSVYLRCTEKGPNKGKLIDGAWTLPEFKTLADVPWETTEKVDGTNVRVSYDRETGEVAIAGRTDRAQLPPHLAAYLSETFTPDALAAADLPSCTLYGEGAGHKIQFPAGKGYTAFGDGAGFVLFDVRVGPFWLRRDDVVDVATRLRLRSTRQYEDMTLSTAISVVRDGFPSFLGGIRAEGLVLRAPHGLLRRNSERLIVKVKTVDFAKGLAPAGTDPGPFSPRPGRE